jgi:hypothetical protein
MGVPPTKIVSCLNNFVGVGLSAISPTRLNKPSSEDAATIPNAEWFGFSSSFLKVSVCEFDLNFYL